MGDQSSKRQTDGAVLCFFFFFLGYHNYIFQAKDLLMEVCCVTCVKAKLFEVSITQLAPGCFHTYWDLQAVFHTLSSRTTNSFLASGVQCTFSHSLSRDQ